MQHQIGYNNQSYDIQKYKQFSVVSNPFQFLMNIGTRHWVYSMRIIVNTNITPVVTNVISRYASQLISSAEVPYYYHYDKND